MRTRFYFIILLDFHSLSMRAGRCGAQPSVNRKSRYLQTELGSSHRVIFVQQLRDLHLHLGMRKVINGYISGQTFVSLPDSALLEEIGGNSSSTKLAFPFDSFRLGTNGGVRMSTSTGMGNR